MEFGGPRKRGRNEASVNGNGGFKKSRPESESLSTGVGSKLKPCTKFFSTSGCSFGEGCHFSHYVPGGYKAFAQMMNLGGAQAPPPSRNPGVPPSFSDASAGKTKLCNKYNSAEGCRFGDNCRFAHGEWELGRPPMVPHEDPRGMGSMSTRMPPQPSGFGAPDNFGASATAKISIDASQAGAVIGKGGMNSKQICRVTGVKLAVRDNEANPNLRNIELEGTFDQIQQATSMVQELMMNAKAAGNGLPPPRKHAQGHTSSGNFVKTKLCENFSKGICTFGDKCHFAHGAEELRKTAM